MAINKPSSSTTTRRRNRLSARAIRVTPVLSLTRHPPTFQQENRHPHAALLGICIQTSFPTRLFRATKSLRLTCIVRSQLTWSQFTAIAVRELLGRPERCVMRLFLVRHQRERLTKLGMELSCAIPHDRQAATPVRAVFRKRGDDNMTAGLYRAKCGPNVCLAIFGGCKEVKYSSVVPYVIGVKRKLCLCNVRLQPRDRTGASTQPVSG